MKKDIIKTRYLRLMPYNDAVKVIDYINKKDNGDYACITSGGVCTQVADKNWDETLLFIKSLNVRFEVTLQNPEEVKASIVKILKENNIIK